MELIDIGINLTHGSYDADRTSVLARAAAAGVKQMIVTGSSLTSTREAIDLSARHADVLVATAGVHPHHASELDGPAIEALRELAQASAVRAVGECGLDYFRDLSPRAVQRQAFAAQLELAVLVGKPVFLHQRDAHADFIGILRDFWPRLQGGVAHCFTGTRDELRAYIDLGLHIGITGWICDERRGAHLLPLMPQIPAERLLLESDGPYLLPRDMTPKPATRRNEPAFLPHIGATVARARNEPIEVLAQSTTLAARKLFALDAHR